MDWMQIISAMALIMLIVILFPQARAMIKDGPKGTSEDWLSAMLPIGAVILFVVLLMALV